MKDTEISLFADMMIQKISEVAGDWKKPWFPARTIGSPQNLSGRKYNGMNSLMLYMHMERHNFSTPVYMTFKQADDINVRINKGEKSFPVLYWHFSVKNKETGEKIDIKDYDKLFDEEKRKYDVISFLKIYRVFNVQQTDFAAIFPEKFKDLEKKFKLPEIKEKEGFSCVELDRMLDQRSWVCPISIRESNHAFYIPLKDEIVVPLKAQFRSSGSFYSTLLHEMAHSTGHSCRLNREFSMNEKKYGKEELIAEMTAALECKKLGISSGIREENCQYLKSWLNVLQKESKFILSILVDINKASKMIGNVLDKETEIKKDEKNDLRSFKLEELPKEEMQKIGINPEMIDAENMKLLLSGKQTNVIGCKVNARSMDMQFHARLSLQRGSDNIVRLMVEVDGQKKEKGFKR